MSNPPEQDFPDVVPKRSTIVLWLSITIALLIGVIWLLAYRALTVHEPQGTVIVDGNDSWADAKVLLISDQSPAFETRLDGSSRYSATFFIEPGRYTIQVRRDGQILYDRSIDVQKGKPELIVLPTTQPTTSATSITTAPAR